MIGFAILGLIASPFLAQSASAQTIIPDWIRNVADWWSDGLVSTDQYVTSLQWLIENGYIQLELGGDVDTNAILSGITSLQNSVVDIDKSQYVPFHTFGVPQGVCDQAGNGPDTDKIIISNSDRTKKFIITGVILRMTGVDNTSDSIMISRFSTAGTLYQVQSVDLTGSHSSSGYPVVFDVMGAQLDPTNTLGGSGNIPYQISSYPTSLGQRISFNITCDAGSTSDIVFGNSVFGVTGWMHTDDQISVTWDEG